MVSMGIFASSRWGRSERDDDDLVYYTPNVTSSSIETSHLSSPLPSLLTILKCCQIGILKVEGMMSVDGFEMEVHTKMLEEMVKIFQDASR